MKMAMSEMYGRRAGMTEVIVFGGRGVAWCGTWMGNIQCGGT